MEEGTGIPVSFHWEDGKKRGVFTPIKKNIEILNDFEKVLGNGQPVNFQIKNSDGELTKVSKEEFVNWMIEGKEEKNIKTPPKEKIVIGASGDIDGTTVFTEIISKDGFIRESYYQPRSEEDKKRIIERNQKRREQELEEKKKELEHQTQNQENSPNSNKQNQQAEENNQQNPSQKLDNKENNNKNVYYGVGVISLVILVISMVVV